MKILDKILRRGPEDPLWERFIHQAPADPASDMSAAIRTATPGKVFPVVSEVPEPARMASDLFELTSFFGGSAMGVAPTRSEFLLPPIDGSDMPSPEEVPNMIVFAVPAAVDPDKAAGLGGQHARREGATVAFNVAAYIRELGFRALLTPIDKEAAAGAAGVAVRKKTFMADDAVLTDLPLAHGAPSLPDTPVNARPTIGKSR